MAGMHTAAAAAFVKFLADGTGTWQAAHLEPASTYMAKPTQ